MFESPGLVDRIAAHERAIAVLQAEQLQMTRDLHREFASWMSVPDPSQASLDSTEATIAELGRR